MEYYPAIKKNTVESVLMRWIKLEPITQSEVSQKYKHQYSILMHIHGIYKDGNDNPICKTEKETQMYRTAVNKFLSRFLTRNFGSQESGSKMSKMLKEKNCQLIILHWPNCTSQVREKLRMFPDKPKLRNFIFIGPARQEMLKAVLQVEIKRQ